jgi:hypothetical protein
LNYEDRQPSGFDRNKASLDSKQGEALDPRAHKIMVKVKPKCMVKHEKERRDD